jgi:hypothetical protein
MSNAKPIAPPWRGRHWRFQMLLLHKDKKTWHCSWSIEAQQSYAAGDDQELLDTHPFMLLFVVSLHLSDSNACRRLNLSTLHALSHYELRKGCVRLILPYSRLGRAVRWPAVIRPTPSSNRVLRWFRHGHPGRSKMTQRVCTYVVPEDVDFYNAIIRLATSPYETSLKIIIGSYELVKVLFMSQELAHKARQIRK